LLDQLPDRLPAWLVSVLAFFHVDFAPEHRQPSVAAVLAASAFAIAGSLAADVILVRAGTHIFPTTKGYVHFQPGDYGKLTVIGVVIACVAWPVVTRISSTPRWLFFRQAIAVTLVLWLPDLYILYKGAPPRAVAVLMVMHLAIALVSYNCLVHVARVRPLPDTARHRHTADTDHYAGRGA
jgi:Family of unknown function (DUF6069)